MYRFLFVLFVILTLATFASHAATGQTPPPTPRLVVSKRANPTTARVGETITYTYRITNTGNVSLTELSVVDDQLGPVSLSLLPGGTALFPIRTLQPGQVAGGSRSYTAQMGDLPGPLVNTVVVTGTSATAVITAMTQTSVRLLMPVQQFLPFVFKPLAVTTTQDELNQDGDCSLREAILAANTDTPVDACLVGAGRQVLLVPPGVYTLDLAGAAEDGNLTGDLDISDELVLIGAGASETILRGSGDRVLHVLTDTQVSVSQVTVTEGHTPDGAASSQPDQPGEDAAPGGGIANYGVLTLTHSRVISSSTGAGGAGYGQGPHVQLGTAGGNGGSGGAFFNAGTAYVSDSLFANNTSGGGGGNGHCARGSSQGGAGGAIYNVGTLRLTATTVTNNQTAAGGARPCTNAGRGGDGADGGGIFNEGTLVIERSTVAFNETAAGGNGCCPGAGGNGGDGGGVFNRGQLTIGNSTVSNNGTGGAGYGISHGSYEPANGRGGSGGGLANLGTLRLAQSTVAANFMGLGGSERFPGPSGLGGGIFNQGTVEILSSIVASNTNPIADHGVDCAGALTSLGYTLVETTTGCTLAGVLTGNLVDIPAGLAPLGDNGGGLLTHALLPTSPAIDAGRCVDLVGQSVLVDERGVARPQGLACDIGAVEAPG